jgi:hypothetical protein
MNRNPRQTASSPTVSVALLCDVVQPVLDSVTFVSLKIMLVIKPSTKLALFPVERVALFMPIGSHSHHGHHHEGSDEPEELPPMHSRLLPLNFDPSLTTRWRLEA